MRFVIAFLLTALLYPAGMADEGMAGVLFAKGAVIFELVPGGAAEKAGLQAGDLLTSIAGTSVVGFSKPQLLAAIRRPVASTGTVEVERGGAKLRYDLTWTPIPPSLTRRDGHEVDGWVECLDGDQLGIFLEVPVGHSLPVGTKIVLPSAAAYGLATVTRGVSHFRVEARVVQAVPLQLWDRVVVAP